MRIVTWNLNHRVGKVRFRLEAANAVIALDADVIVLTEFYPKEFEHQFRNILEIGGWGYQCTSKPTTEVANRILLASRLPIEELEIDLPDFDQQFPSNLLGIRVPSADLSILSIRIPWYRTGGLLAQAWQWTDSALDSLKSNPCVVAGDLNVEVNARCRAGRHLRNLLANGWQRAAPNRPTYFGPNGGGTEIDHILATQHCILREPHCIDHAGGYQFARSSSALSDHVPLTCRVDLLPRVVRPYSCGPGNHLQRASGVVS